MADLLLYGSAILVVILASNIWSTNAQNVNQQRDTEYVSDNVGVSNGEVIASRLPALNGHEPSCEELRAMWR